MAQLTEHQRKVLLGKINPKRVAQVNGQLNMESYDIRAHLNRLFGFEGWDTEILAETVVEERQTDPNRWNVTYRVRMRLTIKNPQGEVVTVKEDGACGSAQNQKTLGDAHDLAYKSAVSSALKRCAVNLGDQFGLSLYAKRHPYEPLVRKVAAYEADGTPEVDADVSPVEAQVEIPAEPSPRAAKPATKSVKPASTGAPIVEGDWLARINALKPARMIKFNRWLEAQGLVPSVLANPTTDQGHLALLKLEELEGEEAAAQGAA